MINEEEEDRVYPEGEEGTEEAMAREEEEEAAMAREEEAQYDAACLQFAPAPAAQIRRAQQRPQSPNPDHWTQQQLEQQAQPIEAQPIASEATPAAPTPQALRRPKRGLAKHAPGGGGGGGNFAETTTTSHSAPTSPARKEGPAPKRNAYSPPCLLYTSPSPRD